MNISTILGAIAIAIFMVSLPFLKTIEHIQCLRLAAHIDGVSIINSVAFILGIAGIVVAVKTKESKAKASFLFLLLIVLYLIAQVLLS